MPTHHDLAVWSAITSGFAVIGIVIGIVVLYHVRKHAQRGELLARVIGRLVIQETRKTREPREK